MSDDELCTRAECAGLPPHPAICWSTRDVPMPEGVDSDECLRRIDAHAPPLSEQQINKLARLLRPY